MEEVAESSSSAAWRWRRIRGYCGLTGMLGLATLFAVFLWRGQRSSAFGPSSPASAVNLLGSEPAQLQSAGMSCGSAALCGVLTLETGLGSGFYAHRLPSVHGLWPQVPPYGTSQCVKPKSSAEPSNLPKCYQNEEAKKDPQHEQEFVDHEWTKHGSCAGSSTAADYFQQICNLSQEPLQVMKTELQKSHNMQDLVHALEQSNFSVTSTDEEHGQLLLSACAVADDSGDYVWKLAAVADFATVCPRRGPPSPSPPGPSPSPPTPAPASCKAGVRGPKCDKDDDCKKLSGCIRCAHSGYCTDQPLSVVV